MATGNWQDDAACAGRYDVDWFDLDCSLKQALEICATCQVGDKCLDYAIQHGITEGVWGGAWGAELIGIVRARRPRVGVHDGW